MTDRNPDDDAACAVCGRVLEWFSKADGSDGHWDHSFQDQPGIDHPPVPTSASSIKVRYRCDFCNLDTEPEQLRLLRCREFEYVPGAVSNDEWLACRACTALIGTDRWADLIERAITMSDGLQAAILLGDTTPAELRSSLTYMYALFRANRVGPIEPFHPHGKAEDAR